MSTKDFIVAVIASLPISGKSRKSEFYRCKSTVTVSDEDGAGPVTVQCEKDIGHMGDHWNAQQDVWWNNKGKIRRLGDRNNPK